MSELADHLQLMLRPAFGSGEDWNHESAEVASVNNSLRPAFGSGEDWNV